MFHSSVFHYLLECEVTVLEHAATSHVVVRIFDDEFAAALEEQFGFSAISATGIAALVFAATSAGANITPPIIVESHPLCFAIGIPGTPGRETDHPR